MHASGAKCLVFGLTLHLSIHLHKPRVLSPLRSLRKEEVDLVPLACEDALHTVPASFNFGLDVLAV